MNELLNTDNDLKEIIELVGRDALAEEDKLIVEVCFEIKIKNEKNKKNKIK